MIVLEENKLVETFYGFIENPKDGLILFQAVRDGILPAVQRRLSIEQRIQIKSGSVFVFNETESNIKRWTDGRNWTPSRVQGDFLIYRELEKNIDKAKRDKKSLKRGLSLKSLDAKKALSSRYESLNIPTFRPDKFFIKLDGLIKKTMSVVIKGQTYHMISYYKENDVLDNKLSTPSEVKSLKKVVISDELLHQLKQPTQKAPGLEEISKMKTYNIVPKTNETSEVNISNDLANNSKMGKQPYINITASPDNTIDINSNLNVNKVNKTEDNKSFEPIKGKNIEEMISQIDDNMHFLQISQNNPHLLNQLHMNPELFQHVTKLLNEKVNNTNNYNYTNGANSENSNILHNIKNNINSLPTSSNHNLINRMTTATTQPNLSLMNTQNHDTISNIHLSNIGNQHHNLNIASLYHQLDNQLHHTVNNTKNEEIHTNEELLNLFIQLAEKSHLEGNGSEKENNINNIKHENLALQEFLQQQQNNPELLNHLNMSLHDLHEVLMQEKNIQHPNHQASTSQAVNQNSINLLHQNIHNHADNQELLEYLLRINEQQQQHQQQQQQQKLPTHHNLNSSLINNVNVEALHQQLSNNNIHTTTTSTPTSSSTIHTSLGHSLPIHHVHEGKQIPIEHKHHQEHIITTEPTTNHHDNNNNDSNNKEQPTSASIIPNENNPEHHLTHNSTEINMSHILQLLNSNQDLDMETLQHLLQYANQEQNHELAHYLETIIRMLAMEEQQIQHNEQQQQHSLNDHPMNDSSHPLYNSNSLHSHSISTLQETENHPISHHNILNTNTTHPSQITTSSTNTAHTNSAHHESLVDPNLLNYMQMHNLHSSLLNNLPMNNNLYTHLNATTNVSQPLSVSHIHPTNHLHSHTSMDVLTSLPTSIQQQLIHAFATDNLTTSVTSHQQPSFTNNVNYSIFHPQQNLKNEDSMEHYQPSSSQQTDIQMDHESLDQMDQDHIFPTTINAIGFDQTI